MNDLLFDREQAYELAKIVTETIIVELESYADWTKGEGTAPYRIAGKVRRALLEAIKAEGWEEVNPEHDVWEQSVGEPPARLAQLDFGNERGFPGMMDRFKLLIRVKQEFPFFNERDGIETAYQRGILTWTEHEYLCGRCDKHGDGESA